MFDCHTATQFFMFNIPLPCTKQDMVAAISHIKGYASLYGKIASNIIQSKLIKLC